MRGTRYVYDEASSGRQVPHTTLRWMLREAGLNGVFGALKQKHGHNTVKGMIIALQWEIDRHALVGNR